MSSVVGNQVSIIRKEAQQRCWKKTILGGGGIILLVGKIKKKNKF
jgi:hypothetical protein